MVLKRSGKRRQKWHLKFERLTAKVWLLPPLRFAINAHTMRAAVSAKVNV